MNFYYLLSILSGALVALMTMQNGVLSDSYGAYGATVIIHIVGLVLISGIMIFKRYNFLPQKKLPPWKYLGGVVGVATTVFSNLAFGEISVSAILALALLGQLLTSLATDRFGLFGMPKHPFHKKKLIGIVFVMGGIMFMVPIQDVTLLLPIILSLLTGFTIVLNRTINAALAKESNVFFSTLYNYITGLAAGFLVLLISGVNTVTVSPSGQPIWVYLGGAVGVIVVCLSNLIVVRISAVSMSLLTFIGQVFTGILIDAMLTGAFSMVNLIGGFLVAVGLAANLYLET